MQKLSLRVALYILLAAVPLALGAALGSRAFAPSHPSRGVQAPEPWSSLQTVLPEGLAKELRSSDHTKRPTVVCVGFRTLYEGAHIPGAFFHGASSTPQGITDLKRWAESMPRSANIVLYCGCCPLQHCPNLNPAFLAMRDMGFTNLRVLLLPNDFNTDWIEKGYPIEKEK